MERQYRNDFPKSEQWGEEEWAERIETLLGLVAEEDSPYRLGQVLQHDAGLELPVTVVKSTYERLFELGATDVHTRLCYARYLLMHGPEWDDEANRILEQLEDEARAAGLLEGSLFGHHPVFYTGPG